VLLLVLVAIGVGMFFLVSAQHSRGFGAPMASIGGEGGLVVGGAPAAGGLVISTQGVNVNTTGQSNLPAQIESNLPAAPADAGASCN
jgi:hypothetical protein